jgi:hypothetical protein
MINRPYEIRKAYQELIKLVAARVYFEDAPENATYPFVVVNLPVSNDFGEGFEVYTMDIDFWDKSTDTTALETLTHDVNMAINEQIVNTAGDALVPSETLTPGVILYPNGDDPIFSFRALLENRRVLNDNDKRLKRRQYTYYIRAIGR